MGATSVFHFLPRISKAVGVGLVVLAFCVLTSNIRNVSGKNIPFSSEKFETRDHEILTVSDSPPPSTTSPEPSSQIELSESIPSSTINFSTSSSSPVSVVMSNATKQRQFRIAIHLKECFDFVKNEEYITLEIGSRSERWTCVDKPKDDIKEKDDDDSSEERRSILRHSGADYVIMQEVIDNLEEVKIIPTLISQNSHRSVLGQPKNSKRATVIVNIYKDVSDGKGCDPGYFDCLAALCPTKCCSDIQSNVSHESHKSLTISSFGAGIFFKSGKPPARCINQKLKCDGNPNCGMKNNHDETNQVCHQEVYCGCQTLCLTWNYVLTSLAIAVLFIITPTAIVFALFHRRNVALERARLTRMANSRVTDLRGEFTRDAPANDNPPTYDDVYDIKAPPPCFCQAVAMENQNEDPGSENVAYSGSCTCREEEVKTQNEPATNNSESEAVTEETEVGTDVAATISNTDTDNK